ncbi:CNDP dipeptidase 2 (metallopeptidase M20 family), isoform CRA_e [Homo sapiens]|nr:CNDP dipeptidase 2 (metallopeptidase M20 family), isoform CRA_e [Homo sapiens]
MAALTTLFKYIDENQDRYIKKLAKWVAIQSVSAWPEKRGEIRRMMEVAAADVKQLGGSVELVDIGKQKLPDGSEIPLPPILLGRLGSDPQKKTVCIYGHLDVQPAALEDGWDSEPFTLVERDERHPHAPMAVPVSVPPWHRRRLLWVWGQDRDSQEGGWQVLHQARAEHDS